MNADKLSCSEMIDVLRGLNLIVSMGDIKPAQVKGKPPRPKFFKQRTEGALKAVTLDQSALKPRLLPQKHNNSQTDLVIQSPVAAIEAKEKVKGTPNSDLRSSVVRSSSIQQHKEFIDVVSASEQGHALKPRRVTISQIQLMDVKDLQSGEGGFNTEPPGVLLQRQTT